MVLQRPGVAYAFWMDSDSLFMAIERPIVLPSAGKYLAISLHSNADSPAAASRNHSFDYINAGHFVLKRSEWADDFLLRVWANCPSPWVIDRAEYTFNAKTDNMTTAHANEQDEQVSATLPVGCPQSQLCLQTLSCPRALLPHARWAVGVCPRLESAFLILTGAAHARAQAALIFVLGGERSECVQYIDFSAENGNCLHVSHNASWSPPPTPRLPPPTPRSPTPPASQRPGSTLSTHLPPSASICFNLLPSASIRLHPPPVRLRLRLSSWSRRPSTTSCPRQR